MSRRLSIIIVNWNVRPLLQACLASLAADPDCPSWEVIVVDNASGEVVFTFDGDEAGQKAALRAFTEDDRFNAQTFVAVAPDGMDPCDLRLQRGDAAVRGLMART